MSSCHVEYKTGDAISTTFLNNGLTLGTSGYYALDIVKKAKFKAQTPKRIRVKKSGYSNYRVMEGVLEPAEFEIETVCQSGKPLAWVHACATTGASDYTHALTIPTVQQPTSAAGALPKLGLRLEGQASDTNAKEIVDLIGCVVTELTLEVSEEGVATWMIKGLAAWVLRGQTKISSVAADPTTTIYQWGHISEKFTFTTGGVAVGLLIKGFTARWTLEFEPISYALIASSYRVCQSFLLTNWDFTVELRGRPYFDGTVVSVKTFLSTSVAALGATIFTFAPTRTTTTDLISYSMSLMQPAEKQDVFVLDRESNGYEELTVNLETKEDSVLTASVCDQVAETSYENTA